MPNLFVIWNISQFWQRPNSSASTSIISLWKSWVLSSSQLEDGSGRLRKKNPWKKLVESSSHVSLSGWPTVYGFYFWNQTSGPWFNIWQFHRHTYLQSDSRTLVILWFLCIMWIGYIVQSDSNKTIFYTYRAAGPTSRNCGDLELWRMAGLARCVTSWSLPSLLTINARTFQPSSGQRSFKTFPTLWSEETAKGTE